MTNACIENQYFSGQGALLLAERETDGSPKGFREVGNISALTLGVETTEFEHKESCSGVRGIDLTIVQEINATMSMTVEHISKENLSLALYGSNSAIAGASVTDEPVVGHHDLWTRLENIKVSAVVVTDVGGATTYTLGTDYEENLESGTIKVLSTGAITDSQALEVDYTYAAQDDVQGVVSGVAPIRWARFEGLNTADSNKPVVIDMFKVSMQPLAELAMINDEITQMEVEGKVLSDALRASGSNYFRIRKVS